MFHIWNNGRSVFNIDHISRILVYGETDLNPSSIFKVVMSNGIQYEISQHEYLKLMEIISDESNMNCKLFPDEKYR